MTERVHMQISKLLIGCVIAATAATSALIIELLVGMPEMAPGPGPNGEPPRPPELRPLAVLIIVMGWFVLAWLAVLVVFARDQILARLATPPAPTQDELSLIDKRLAEYGEHRETDGYLQGMRAAAAEPNVRALRRTPPNQR